MVMKCTNISGEILIHSAPMRAHELRRAFNAGIMPDVRTLHRVPAHEAAFGLIIPVWLVEGGAFTNPAGVIVGPHDSLVARSLASAVVSKLGSRSLRSLVLRPAFGESRETVCPFHWRGRPPLRRHVGSARRVIKDRVLGC